MKKNFYVTVIAMLIANFGFAAGAPDVSVVYQVKTQDGQIKKYLPGPVHSCNVKNDTATGWFVHMDTSGSIVSNGQVIFSDKQDAEVFCQLLQSPSSHLQLTVTNHIALGFEGWEAKSVQVTDKKDGKPVNAQAYVTSAISKTQTGEIAHMLAAKFAGLTSVFQSDSRSSSDPSKTITSSPPAAAAAATPGVVYSAYGAPL